MTPQTARDDGRPAGSLGFVENALGRSTVESDPEGALQRGREPGALAVAVVGETVLLRPGAAGASGLTALLPAGRFDLGPAQETVVLGTLAGATVLAHRHEADTAHPDLVARDLRSLAVEGLVPPGELGLLAQAKSLLGWHARNGFCAQCGQPTASQSAGLKRECAACGTQHFPRTDPVVIMLVVEGERCLLGRQARFVAGSYSCLAGFVSPGETIEDAVRREVAEEAGIRVGRVTYQASQPWPFPSSLMIGCRGEAESLDITIDRTELEDARWFTRDEVRAMMARRHPDGLITPPPMAIAHHLMALWADGEPASG